MPPTGDATTEHEGRHLAIPEMCLPESAVQSAEGTASFRNRTVVNAIDKIVRGVLGPALAHVTSMVEPFHEFLRQTFRDTAAEKGGPGDFLEEIRKQLPKLLWDGSDIHASADLDTPVGNLSAKDVQQLEEAADRVGVSLTVEEGELTLSDLAELAKKITKAIERDLRRMAAAECWEE